ncbi:MAG: AAA family ATPase, partial [Bacillota bacterium]
MYLKRLEVHGFKSFGRRVSVELEQGLNAVVGPNGCGKSNLLDAIRWALGEPSVRSLRGGRTEDIIFGGTRDVRPLGMAEVVLTFDNASGALGVSYREVELTRRAYRSGQSFFAINGIPCRLRDIHELLSRANFSARSHVLVPQGAAEALAVGSGEERRAALDEVAGIARFRQVSATVQSVQQRARQAMDRAQAALGESARHVAFLERQASRARRARELYEALKTIDLEILRREALAAHDHHAEADLARQAAEEQLEKARSALQESRERMQALLGAHGELGARLSQLSGALEESRRTLLERQHEMDRASDREFDAAGRLERARARLSGLSRQIEEVRARIGQLERARLELAGRREQVEAEHRELSARLEAAAAGVSEKEKALEEQRGRLLEALERVAGARNELIEAARQYEAQRRESQRTNERCEEIRQRWAGLEERVQELDAQIASLDARLEETSRRQQELAQEMKVARDQIRQLEQVASEAELERTRIRGQLRLLEQAHDELEGFSRGVRAVMAANAPWRKEIWGPLAQLVRVPQGLEEAAAAALGAFMEAVAVGTADAARQAIEFLRERRLGWVTFLPLDFLRPRGLSPTTKQGLSRLPGWVGLASELLEVDAPLRVALEYAAGRVAVMESLADALEAGRRAPELARVVTRRGEVVVPGGPVSGGFREHSRAEVLARARQMEEVQKQLQ